MAVPVRRASRRTARSATLGTMQPTSKFGEMFQYSNPLAGAAGFVGGHVAYPDARARRRLRQRDADAGVRPARHEGDHLRLRARARAATTPMPHAPDVDGKPAHAVMEVNYSIIPLRPAGGGVEQRPRHARATSRWSWPRARCRTASATSAQDAAAGAPRAAGADRQGRDLRHGADGRHARTACRSSTTAAT